VPNYFSQAYKPAIQAKLGSMFKGSEYASMAASAANYKLPENVIPSNADYFYKGINI